MWLPLIPAFLAKYLLNWLSAITFQVFHQSSANETLKVPVTVEFADVHINYFLHYTIPQLFPISCRVQDSHTIQSCLCLWILSLLNTAEGRIQLWITVDTYLILHLNYLKNPALLNWCHKTYAELYYCSASWIVLISRKAII